MTFLLPKFRSFPLNAFLLLLWVWLLNTYNKEKGDDPKSLQKGSRQSFKNKHFTLDINPSQHRITYKIARHIYQFRFFLFPHPKSFSKFCRQSQSVYGFSFCKYNFTFFYRSGSLEFQLFGTFFFGICVKQYIALKTHHLT